MLWTTLIEALVGVLVIIGGVTATIGSFGMVRFNDFYVRIHGAAMCSTVGTGSAVLASMLFFWMHLGSPLGQELLITLFTVITTPVSAHLLTMSALHLKLPRQANTEGGPFELNERIDQN